MRLQWFEIRGYKNIRDPLRLEELGRLNVLHGDNNVGKSNLLESIGLFFMLLQTVRQNLQGTVSRAESFARRTPPEALKAEGLGEFSTVRSFAYFTDNGFPPGEIFNLQDAMPIELGASVRLEAGDVEDGDSPWFMEALELGFRLERREDEILIALVRLRRADGTDVAVAAESGNEQSVERVFERLGWRRRGRGVEPRFALIRADRTLVGAPREDEAAPLATREPLPKDLGLALYDADTADDPVLRERFRRFLSALERFRDLLGDGQWRMRYDRQADQAELFYDTGTTRVPLRLMGSGIQQIVSLTARLMMTGADIVAVEEPELNLRYTAQRRLWEILSDLVGGQAPSQLLLTSHSPAFEAEEMFYALRRSPSGPRVEQRPRKEAADFTQFTLQTPPGGASAPLSYVTTEGLVLVPADVREALGLENGGGVVFIREKNAGHYRMLTNAQFLDMLEPRKTSP
ncbi:AAA family ATPase [Archangium sp.]|uniref:ATP-binding protein n=1 Tax=Archangium sp. TaxID=1872627 RepID=UPI00286B0746|nr:AAA family ATPase [Archangium sp.]